MWRKVGGSLGGVRSSDSSCRGGFSYGPSFPRGAEEAASMQNFMVNYTSSANAGSDPTESNLGRIPVLQHNSPPAARNSDTCQSPLLTFASVKLS